MRHEERLIESAAEPQGYFLIGNTNCRGLLILMEPNESVRDALQSFLRGEGWQVSFVESAEELICELELSRPVAVISESRLPATEASHVLATCIEQQIPLIFTGHERAVQQAVDLVQQGAAGYLEKPFSPSRLLQLLDQFPDRHNSGANGHS